MIEVIRDNDGMLIRGIQSLSTDIKLVRFEINRNKSTLVLGLDDYEVNIDSIYFNIVIDYDLISYSTSGLFYKGTKIDNFNSFIYYEYISNGKQGIPRLFINFMEE